MNDYTMVDGSAELEWLSSDVWMGDLGLGCWRKGFEANAVILHAIWRDPRDQSEESHGEREARLRASGALAATSDFEAHLQSLTTLASVGLPENPERDLVRVRWADYAREHGGKGDFSARAVPSMALTRHESAYPMMAANVAGPNEGFLDELQAAAVVSLLVAAGGDQPVFKHAAYQYWLGPGERPPLMRTTLQALISTMNAPHLEGEGFGQNVWPEDHTWVTCTDWDSYWTVISGTQTLIDSIVEHPELEAYQVDPQALAEDLARVRAAYFERNGAASTDQP